MKINMNSWHYKVWEYTYSFGGRSQAHNTNLCAYMRRIVFLAPFYTIVSLFAVAIFIPFFLVARLLQIIAMLPFGYRPDGWDFDDYTKFTKSKPKSPQQPKQPSLLKEWIKAKKQKVCPLIEFEYE